MLVWYVVFGMLGLRIYIFSVQVKMRGLATGASVRIATFISLSAAVLQFLLAQTKTASYDNQVIALPNQFCVLLYIMDSESFGKRTNCGTEHPLLQPIPIR